MNEQLEKLAARLGVATTFSDAGLKRQEYQVCENTIRFFTKVLGYSATNDEQVLSSLEKLDNERYRRPLQPIYVCNQHNLMIDVVAPDVSTISITAQNSKGETIELAYEYQGFADANNLLYRQDLRITTLLEIGYYELKVTVGGKTYTSTLAVAPDKCYNIINREQKLWGYALQLYALKSKRNWGVGDFTDLQNFVKLAASSGADVIGLNPLNTLSHDYPENASPYSSISRQFLNPIYIDIENVPEFLPEDKDEDAALIEELRAAELIDYKRVYPLKVKFLEKCFARFSQNKNSARKKDFTSFCKLYGESLERLAAFQAIYEIETQKIWGGWRAWPKELQMPDSDAVKDFIAQNKERVEFFKFMQFEADRQFACACEEVCKQGLKVGFYRDLAVGVGRDSAEVWSNPSLFMKDAGTGAPPDAFFPCGQKWGLGTFLPKILKEQKYEPFIQILRANMRSAGALRIDHVMSLMRLYVIPDKMEQGTYIYYNFEDMLNLVALESCLNKCVVVGESIGNVPEGFLDALAAKNIHSLSILWAERWDAGWGDFKQPEGYPINAFASVATHDIAPLKMWWFGYDIELSHSLGMLDKQERTGSYHKREADRRKLLSALDRANVWPEDKYRRGDYIYGEGYPEGIEEAVSRFMAKSASPVFLSQLEDILQVEEMQNLPGTDRDKHPNWRRKLPVDLEDLAKDDRYIRCVSAIRKER